MQKVHGKRQKPTNRIKSALTARIEPLCGVYAQQQEQDVAML